VNNVYLIDLYSFARSNKFFFLIMLNFIKYSVLLFKNLRGGNRFRWFKKFSNFFLFHKLLVKLFKNMFPKFQIKISIRSDVVIGVSVPRGARAPERVTHGSFMNYLRYIWKGRECQQI